MEDFLWVVIRCNPKKTLTVLGDLEAAHLRAWTPARTRRKRRPRSRQTRIVQEPLLPGFVFVQAVDIEDAGGFSCLEPLFVKPMTSPLGYAFRVKESELSSLREEASRDLVDGTEAPPTFALGSCWKLLDGPAKGSVGKVIEVRSSKVLLQFNVSKSRGFWIGGFQLVRSAIRVKPELF